VRTVRDAQSVHLKLARALAMISRSTAWWRRRPRGSRSSESAEALHDMRLRAPDPVHDRLSVAG
jgi:hypothetical protein